MQMHRHHLLEIILWPNGDGTFRKIINSRERLIELGIYYDWKLTITIPADEHSRMHAHNRADDTNSKISATLIGNTNGEGNKGKKLSDDTKRKMSAAKKGKKLSAEHRAKISAAQKGKKGNKHSEEAKAKISTALIGNTNSKGSKHSEEAKAKMSAAHKGKKLSEEHRAKMSAAHKGKKHTEEAKAKMSAAKKGKKYEHSRISR